MLGSNLGDRTQYLLKAQKLLEETGITILTRSSIYETAAWGVTDQPSFYNQVLQIETTLSPEALLDALLEIEKKMGRIRKEKWGERIIDIDILYYDQLSINTANLKIPHPGIAVRRFTLTPLVEIAPDFIHPILHSSNRKLLHELSDDLFVHRIT